MTTTKGTTLGTTNVSNLFAPGATIYGKRVDRWEPITGCTKVSDGCANCYAERVFPRVYGRDPWPEPFMGTDGPDMDGRRRRFTDIRIHRDRFDKPLHWRKPRMVFVNSMSDLFHEDVPFDVIDELVGIMAAAPQHTFQVLTKRPKRMLEWRDHAAEIQTVTREQCDGEPSYGNPRITSNIWWGVSAENQPTLDRRSALLAQMPGKVLFVSLEPLLGEIDCGNAFDGPGESSPYRAIDWVIVGGESGPNARPMNPDWVRSIRDQCQQAGVPFFFKQWGEWSPPRGDEIQRRLDVGLRPTHVWPDFSWSVRLGKKIAGRQLDGREWNEMP